MVLFVRAHGQGQGVLPVTARLQSPISIVCHKRSDAVSTAFWGRAI